MLKTFKVEQILPDAAEKLCRAITFGLPDYFGLSECNESYANGVRERINFAAKSHSGSYVGLLSLDFPHPNNSNIYWMAVQRDVHDQGVGQLLIKYASQYATAHNAKTMTVETLSPTETDLNYLRTYKFYETCGFNPLFNLQPSGYNFTMVYMLKNLKLDDPLSDLINLELDVRDFGFYWPNTQMIIEQAISECEEIKDAILNDEPSHRVQEEIGDLLHTAVSLCVFAGYDPGQTLVKVTEKFTARMNTVKKLTKQRGLLNLKGQPTEFLLELWKEAKKQNK